MGRDPAVLFYTSDFLTGTQFFTDEQCGQYIKLLCLQHQLGNIPNQHMLNICKTYDNPVFAKFIKDDNGGWYNKRMKEEQEKRTKYCESRRSNKIKGLNRPSLKDNICSTYETHMENENDNSKERNVVNQVIDNNIYDEVYAPGTGKMVKVKKSGGK